MPTERIQKFHLGVGLTKGKNKTIQGNIWILGNTADQRIII